jgi:uncharacterized Zn finger protein (UPF0148 family)
MFTDANFDKDVTMTEFGTINLEELAVEEQRLSETNGKRDDIFISIPKPKQGGTTLFPLRLLPPVLGEKLFQYTRLHMIKGHSVHCPKDLVKGKKGEPVWDRNTYCPICEYYNSLWRRVDRLEDQGKKAEAEKIKKEARSLKPIERYYYNAIARSEKDSAGNVHPNVGPKIYSCGKTVHKMIVRGIQGDKETKEPGLGDVTNPKTGYDFLVKMEIRGEEEYPNYDRTSFARETSPAGKPEEVKRWAGSLHDLKALRKPATVEELETELARHRGLIDDEEAGFDVEAFDAKHRTGGTPTRTTHTDAGNGIEVEDTDADDAVTPSAPAEDVSIDDEQFMAELQSMADDE